MDEVIEIMKYFLFKSYLLLHSDRSHDHLLGLLPVHVVQTQGINLSSQVTPHLIYQPIRDEHNIVWTNQKRVLCMFCQPISIQYYVNFTIISIQPIRSEYSLSSTNHDRTW